MKPVDGTAVQVIVPLKAVRSGKTRLGAVLEPATRERLILTMLETVLGALRRSRGVAGVSVLTPDARLVPAACAHMPDPGLELNAALVGAARRLRSEGAEYLLVLAADLPFATCEDLECLIDARAVDSLVAGEDWRGSGTNALLWNLRHGLTPCFGPQSLSAHAALARGLHLEFVRIARPGLAFDVDEPEQLASLRERGGARFGFLS